MWSEGGNNGLVSILVCLGEMVLLEMFYICVVNILVIRYIGCIGWYILRYVW